MAISGDNHERLYIDPSDPLFLHPSDHPGMILISKPLDGTNFGAWRKSMAIALSAKNKLSFVNGEVPKPPVGDRYYNSWQRCNDMITSWFLNVLSSDIAESVLYSENAIAIWRELNERFGQVNGARLYHLQKEISSIEQGSNDIATYYTRYKKVSDELVNLRSYPPCVCHCLQSMKKYEEDQQLIQFLMGLNSDYNMVRGSILMMKSLPSVNQAYSILIQEEQQREIAPANHLFSDSAAMTVGNRRSFVNPRVQGDEKSINQRQDYRRTIVCNHCGKTGHVASKCYRLIGFTKDFKFTRGKRIAAAGVFEQDTDSQGVAEQRAWNPRNTDLTRDEYHQVMKILNKVQLDDNSKESTVLRSGISCANLAGTILKSLLSSVEKGFGTMNWILDSGATMHMCFEKRLFTELKELRQSFPITLPNGESILVSHIGEIILFKGLTLKEVLYVPQFRYNLLSLGKLCSETNSSVVLTSRGCFMQGPFMKEPVLLGKVHSGLYLFQGTSKLDVEIKAEDFERKREEMKENVVLNCRDFFVKHHDNNNVTLLWHHRLGHLPIQKLKMLNVAILNKSMCDFCCEICHKARQHRL